LKSISLLPPEIRLQRQARVRRAKNIKLGGMLFLALLIIYTGVGLSTLYARSRVVSLHNQRALLEMEMAGFREYIAMENRINKLEGLVKKATDNSPDWVSMLVSINRNIPPGVWLTDFRGVSGSGSKKNEPGKRGSAASAKTSDSKETSGQTAKPSGVQGEVVIRGLTSDHSALAEWLDKINKSGLSDARLQSAGRETGGETPLINFEITAGIQSQPPPAKAEGGGGQ